MDIVEGVSLLKNTKDFQVMLPWCNPASGSATGSGSNSNINTQRNNSTSSAAAMDMTSVMNALDEHDHEQELGDHTKDELAVTQENNERDKRDLNEYFTPISVSCGVKAVVSCGVEPDDVNSRMKMRKKKKALGIQDFVPEDVYMLVKVSRVGEERARVVVHTLRDSVNLFKKAPAVPANTRLDLLIALPSVLTVEVCSCMIFVMLCVCFDSAGLTCFCVIGVTFVCSRTLWRITSEMRQQIFEWNTIRKLAKTPSYLTEGGVDILIKLTFELIKTMFINWFMLGFRKMNIITYCKVKGCSKV